MFGKLSLSAIPYHDPIVMGAVVGSVLAALAVLGLITYFRQWPTLWREWLTTVDHKKIGIMYILLALVMLLRGFSDALMMRAQQAMAVGASQGFLPPDHFNQVFSAHGTIMILFMAMPFLSGLVNIVVPQQIGARDVAFPFLNAVSLWLTVAGALLVMVSLGVGEFSKAGWSGYAPLTELQYSPDTGVDYWIWSLQITGLGTLLSGINFLVTVLTMRAPGMTLMRMPLFTWTSVFTNVLIIFSFPVLTVALALVSMDRYLGMHFFSNDFGGNMMLYANLFWTWGHPEVYIVILPAFGVFSEVVSTFSRKRLFGYPSLVYATAAIMFLSFAVWVHHFFTMGASAGVNIAFGISTMLIAIPTGVKVFNWLLTMYRGRVTITTPMLWTLGFLTTFVLGGLAGVLLAMPPADYVLHNSLFLIAHFHNMLVPGTLFGFLAGYAYWFPKAVGFRLDETWGKLSFWCWLVGFYLAFVPLYILGFMGMPRRMQHYDNPAWQPYLIVAALGTLLVAAGIGCMLLQLFVSFKNRKALRDATGDPWDGRTLEWATASPPAPYNFAVIPTVHGLDAFWDMKRSGEAYKRPEAYQDIEMPKNCAHGFLLGILAFLFGFAMIWHIWWLAGAGFLGLLFVVVARSMDDDTTEIIPAAEVARIEDLRFAQMAAAGRS
ncbi:cytochrome o ubiquinol oxidase subunit I [Solidesulfovibrio sp.]|uniref:cytochrome o ubiquinol oxidase subunit I n=1 Tax=Solidesulfovibrio sp. TaxID=2910990 RepID=UPI002B203F61|nr:cytochrome o ubiquinol oxidase subunit I [Solidesulfovibrio sp.]MEA5089389.1 cytochrome o ubiquinol oxidase subunit I [Solidesulfovibrio sp.]HML62270.1 cytochrome o ubiquinol oxidase subunit I [Solidesulfovibrio sp.]